MPVAVTEFRETPNPNAVKCLLDRPIADVPRSYFDASSASSDPIASRLFELPGVANVLIHGDWITVGKRPGAPWPAIRRGIQRILGEVA